MATILVDGLAMEAAQLICDPLPRRSSAPLLLRVRCKNAHAKRFEYAVQIVFPYAGELYRGEFRQVAVAEYASEIEHIFISEGPVDQHVVPLLPRPLARIFKWRGER